MAYVAAERDSSSSSSEALLRSTTAETAGAPPFAGWTHAVRRGLAQWPERRAVRAEVSATRGRDWETDGGSPWGHAAADGGPSAPRVTEYEERVEFSTLVLRPGDCLSAVANLCGTPVAVLKETNNIADAQRVKAGQALRVPRRQVVPVTKDVGTRRHLQLGLWHMFVSQPVEDAPQRAIANVGDSLWALAHRFQVSVEELRAANCLPQDGKIHPGQELVIPMRPGARSTGSWTVSAGTTTQTSHFPLFPSRPQLPSIPLFTLPLPLAKLLPPPPLSLQTLPATAATMLQLPPPPLPSLGLLLRHHEALRRMRTAPVVGPVARVLLERLHRPETFILPVQGGWLSSQYGWKDGRWYFHNGIDIAVENGTQVKSVASGRVTWSGWKGGYGKTVCVDHGDGVGTLYAHCDDLLVRPGQIVARGQCIGLSGNTGHSTGPHLHFEVHKDGRTVEPLDLLPSIG